ncbi:MAG TPA: hypothetical protein QF571_04740 [Desulfobacterales bacterium]|nr:hypothetical protein [Desulfobacterales bacterium]
MDGITEVKVDKAARLLTFMDELAVVLRLNRKIILFLHLFTA